MAPYPIQASLSGGKAVQPDIPDHETSWLRVLSTGRMKELTRPARKQQRARARPPADLLSTMVLICRGRAATTSGRQDRSVVRGVSRRRGRRSGGTWSQGRPATATCIRLLLVPLPGLSRSPGTILHSSTPTCSYFRHRSRESLPRWLAELGSDQRHLCVKLWFSWIDGRTTILTQATRPRSGPRYCSSPSSEAHSAARPP